MEHQEKDERLVPAHEKFTEEAAAERPSVGALLETRDGREIVYPSGWRLCFVLAGIWISFYLVNLEVTIVSTSLIAMTDELKGFDKTGWITTAFLSTFTGFMSVWTKVGDIIGRKKTILAADVMFLLFSLGCGLSQTADQLVICRAFQGIGGAGVYPLGILCIYEIAPKPKLPIYGGTLAIAVALASLTGPIFGGALAQSSAWRWVFYVNLPPGFLAVSMLFLAMPPNYGSIAPKPLSYLKPSMWLFRQLDIVGTLLLLTGAILLVAVLNEAGQQFSWSSGTTIGLLVVCGLSWIAFFVWEWVVSEKIADFEQIFPGRALYNRAWIGMLIATFVSGCPWNVVVVYLTQRLQILTKASPLMAGVRLIPYSAVSTIFTSAANLASLKGRIPFVYFALAGSILHIVGMVLLSCLPETNEFPAAGYAYEVIAGAGIGTTIGILILAVPYVVETRDLAIATGAMNQGRFLGGAIGLSIASNILSDKLHSKLDGKMPSEELDRLLEAVSIIPTLPTNLRALVEKAFAEGYTMQFRVMIAFTAVQVPASLLLLRRRRQYVVE